MPDTTDKMMVAQYYQRKIYIVNNKISQLVKTRKHYESWMECSNSDPNNDFVQYLEDQKRELRAELDYWKKKLSEV